MKYKRAAQIKKGMAAKKVKAAKIQDEKVGKMKYKRAAQIKNERAAKIGKMKYDRGNKIKNERAAKIRAAKIKNIRTLTEVEHSDGDIQDSQTLALTEVEHSDSEDEASSGRPDREAKIKNEKV